MERLTMRNDTTKEAFLIDIDDDDVKDAIHKLADYEDAEEQGLIIRLPCRVGDTYYRIMYGDVYECKFASLSSIMSFIDEGSFGKTVFFSRVDAETVSASVKKVRWRG